MPKYIGEAPGEWWETHDNIIKVARWMADNADGQWETFAREVLYMLEKPWKYTDEYKRACEIDKAALTGDVVYCSHDGHNVPKSSAKQLKWQGHPESEWEWVCDDCLSTMRRHAAERAASSE